MKRRVASVVEAERSGFEMQLHAALERERELRAANARLFDLVERVLMARVAGPPLPSVMADPGFLTAVTEPQPEPLEPEPLPRAMREFIDSYGGASAVVPTFPPGVMPLSTDDPADEPTE